MSHFDKMIKNKDNTLQNSHLKARWCIILVLAIVLYTPLSSSITWDNIAYWDMSINGGNLTDIANGRFNLSIGYEFIDGCIFNGKVGSGFGTHGVDIVGGNHYCMTLQNAVITDARTLDLGYGNNTISFWYKRYKNNTVQNTWILTLGNRIESGLQSPSGAGFMESITPFGNQSEVIGWGTYWNYNETILTRENLVSPVNEWHHYVQVRKAGIVYMYKDGILQTHTTGYSQNMSPYSNGIGFLSRGGQSLNGSIDEVGVWNRALTDAEITGLYNAGIGLTYGDQPAYLVFNNTIHYPVNNSISYILNRVSFNSTITTKNYTLENSTLYIWHNTGELYELNFTSDASIEGVTEKEIYSSVFNIGGDFIWNIYACVNSSECKFSSKNFTLNIDNVEVSNTSLLNSIYETSSASFNITIQGYNISTLYTNFYYNGSKYQTTSSCNLSWFCTINSYIDIPLVTSGIQQVKNYFWEIFTYDGAMLTSENTTQGYQNVTRIEMGLCNSTLNIKTLNFTAWNEQNLSKINPFYFKGTFEYWLGGGSVRRNVSINLPETSNVTLCINPVNQTFYSDAIIEYSFKNTTIDYPARSYYLSNQTLTNSSIDRLLYLIDTSGLTSFLIVVQTQAQAPVADAYVYIQKYYAGEGIYKTVQIAKTDANGKTAGYYEILTTDYKHIIIKDGEVLLETTPQKIIPESTPYTLTFTVGSAQDYAWQPWANNTDIVRRLEYNSSSKLVTFSYIDITNSITSGTLTIIQESYTNNSYILICNNTVNLASATLTCDLSGYTGEFIARGILDSEVIELIRISISDIESALGSEGIILGFFLILVGSLAFFFNATAGVVGVNASLITTKLLGLINIPPLAIFAILAISIFAIILMRD